MEVEESASWRRGPSSTWEKFPTHPVVRGLRGCRRLREVAKCRLQQRPSGNTLRRQGAMRLDFLGGMNHRVW